MIIPLLLFFQVYIVPAFEMLHNNTTFPETKQELLEFWATKKIQPFE